MKIAGHEDEIRRITGLLEKLMQLEGRSQRSMEQELGLGTSGMSKILKGVVRLQLNHVLMILEVLGIPPGQFFQLAFHETGREHPSLAKLRQMEGSGEEEDSPEFDARVGRALLRILAEQLRREA